MPRTKKTYPVMLNKIQVQVINNALWFKAADCARVLDVRTDKITNKSYITSRLITNCKYITEVSFQLLFKSDNKILAELEDYKQALCTESYSNLLTIAYSYVCLDGSTRFFENSKLGPTCKKDLLNLSGCEDVTLALLEVYLNARFLQVSTIALPSRKDILYEAPDYLMLEVLQAHYPVKILSNTLYDIYQGKQPSALFKQLLFQAQIKKSNKALRQELSRHFLPDEVSMMSKRVIAGDKNKLLFSHYNYPLPYARKPYYLLGPSNVFNELPEATNYENRTSVQPQLYLVSDPRHKQEPVSVV